MYKNLCTDGLGVSVRQNELIELALTYGFRGIEIDMADMAGRAESMGQPFATQFINSASVEVGTFGLPCDLSASDEDFARQQERLDLICELAQSIKAKRCFVEIAPQHPSLQYHENFEQHRARIKAIADKLAQVGTRCGLKLNAARPDNEGMQFIHKPEEMLALVKTVDHDNVGIAFDTWHWQAGQFDPQNLAALDISKISEVRLADPPEGFSLDTIDPSDRVLPGTHPNSICREVVNWLVENDFDGPVSLTAQIPESPANPGSSLFERIASAFDRFLSGEEFVPSEEVPSSEIEDEAVSTAVE